MKIFIKLMLLVLVLGLAAPFFLKKPDGTPLMNGADVFPSRTALESLWAKTINKITAASSSAGRQLGNEQMGKTEVYRWQARDGSWRFSDKPPQGAAQVSAQGVETVYVDPNTNVIQGLPEASPTAVSEEVEQQESVMPSPMTVSPLQAQKMMEDARKVQTLLNERNQALDNMKDI